MQPGFWPSEPETFVDLYLLVLLSGLALLDKFKVLGLWDLNNFSSLRHSPGLAACFGTIFAAELGREGGDCQGVSELASYSAQDPRVNVSAMIFLKFRVQRYAPRSSTDSEPV